MIKKEYVEPVMEVLSLATMQETLQTNSVLLNALLSSPSTITGDNLADPESEYNPW